MGTLPQTEDHDIYLKLSISGGLDSCLSKFFPFQSSFSERHKQSSVTLRKQGLFVSCRVIIQQEGGGEVQRTLIHTPRLAPQQSGSAERREWGETSHGKAAVRNVEKGICVS